MIVEFSIKNVRSIKDLQTLSFAKTGLKSRKEFSFIDSNNISECNGEKCFNVLGLYGANASGKSNIVKALDYFINTISVQPSSQSNLSHLSQPFLFQENPEETESFFQMVFMLNQTKYRYGFTVKKNLDKRIDGIAYSSEIITNEWLFSDKGKKMSPLFIREGSKNNNKLQNKSGIPNTTPYKHNLFLTHAAAFDITGDCKEITDYFKGFAVSDFEFSHEKFRWLSIESIIHKNDDLKNEFLSLLNSFNLNFDDIILEENQNYNSNEIFPQEKISLVKNFQRENKEIKKISLNLKQHESSGTQKMFDLAGLLLRAFNLPTSCFILLDEIDSHFHPALLINLVNLFNNPRINKSNSQLLFSSHDTNLMAPTIMRRDQFYFTEKNIDFSTKLYSLADLKGIRNDADFAKQYLAGFYGALPHLEQFEINESSHG